MKYDDIDHLALVASFMIEPMAQIIESDLFKKLPMSVSVSMRMLYNRLIRFVKTNDASYIELIVHMTQTINAKIMTLINTNPEFKLIVEKYNHAMMEAWKRADASKSSSSFEVIARYEMNVRNGEFI
jgi:hypothetical protein